VFSIIPIVPPVYINNTEVFNGVICWFYAVVFANIII
jgi:hypothetical protein